MTLASACIVHPRWIQPRGDDDGYTLLPPASAWQCDLADESLTWGEEVFDLFGIPRGARVDRREIVAMYDDASRGRLERLRRQAITLGTGFTLDARICTLAGEWRWMRIKATTLVRGGRAIRLYGTKNLLPREAGVTGWIAPGDPSSCRGHERPVTGDHLQSKWWRGPSPKR